MSNIIAVFDLFDKRWMGLISLNYYPENEPLIGQQLLLFGVCDSMVDKGVDHVEVFNGQYEIVYVCRKGDNDLLPTGVERYFPVQPTYLGYSIIVRKIRELSDSDSGYIIDTEVVPLN